MNNSQSKQYIKLKRSKGKGYLTGANITGGKLPIIFKGVSKNKDKFYFVQDGNVVKFINKKTKKCYSYIGKIKRTSKINISDKNIKSHPRNYYKLKFKNTLVNHQPVFKPSTPRVQGEYQASGNYNFTPSTPNVKTIANLTPKLYQSPQTPKISRTPRPPKIRRSPKNRRKSKSKSVTPSITPLVYGPSTFTPATPSIITTPIEKKDYSIYIYSGVALLILLIIIVIYYYFSS
jgi:hypothetical protein